MIVPIFQLAAASADVVALLGEEPTRLYSRRAQQETVPPYAVWRVISDPPVDDLDGADMANVRVQVDSYSADEDECDRLDDALAKAIENQGENVNLGLSVDEQDQATGLYRRSRDFSLWVPR